MLVAAKISKELRAGVYKDFEMRAVDWICLSLWRVVGR